MMMNKLLPATDPANEPSRRSDRPTRSPLVAAFCILALAGASLMPLSAAQGAQETAPCAENGMNTQCTEFGSIRMESRRDIRGDPIDLKAQIVLNTGYADRGARWVMFSIRNVTDDGHSPVTIGLNRFFSSSGGDIVTTRIEKTKPSEINLWVDVLDLPIGTPISLDLKIGATERGAYALETLVLAFDRGYAPVQDGHGNDASLFSFTLLGVNQETQSTAGEDDESLANGNKLPSLGAFAALGVLLVAASAIHRRRVR